MGLPRSTKSNLYGCRVRRSVPVLLSSIFLLTSCSAPISVNDTLKTASGAVHDLGQKAGTAVEWTKEQAAKAKAAADDVAKRANTVVGGVKKIGEGIGQVGSGMKL